MNYRYLVMGLCVAALLLAAGCKNINIPGNLAGQVLNEAGQGQGYVSVACINTENGAEVARETAEDGGNFFFEKVDAGTYIVKVYSMSGKELPCDAKPVNLGAGRTESIVVTLIPEE